MLSLVCALLGSAGWSALSSQASQAEVFLSRGNLLVNPRLTAVDSIGNAYVSGIEVDSSDPIYKVTPGGVVTKVSNRVPSHLVVDAADTLFFISDRNIWSITPDGVETLVMDSEAGEGHALAITRGPTGIVALINNSGLLIQPISPPGPGTPFSIEDPFWPLSRRHLLIDAEGTTYVASRFNDPDFGQPFTDESPYAGLYLVPAGGGQAVSEYRNYNSSLVDVALGEPGMVFVAVGGGVVYCVDIDGFLTVVLSGTGGIGAIDSDAAGNLYATYWATDEVVRLTPSGSLTTLADASGDGLGHVLDLPLGLTFDEHTGDLYVAGSSSQNAFRVTPAGVVTKIIDSTTDGTAMPWFELPRSLAVHPDGDVSVGIWNAELGTRQLLRASTTGEIEQAVDFSGDVDYVTAGPSNSVYCSVGGDEVHQVDAAGNATLIWDSSTTVTGIAVDPAGTVFVTGGGFLWRVDGPDDATILTNHLSGARAPLLDPFGNVYFAGQGADRVVKWSPDGTELVVLDSSGDGGSNPLEEPVALALDGAGNLYVTGFVSDNVFRVDPRGGVTAILTEQGDGGYPFSEPMAVTVGPAGHVYVMGEVTIPLPGGGVLDRDAVVLRVDPDGPVIRVFDEDGDGDQTWREPIGMAGDDQGNVYVSGRSSHNVFRIPGPACFPAAEVFFRVGGTNPSSYSATAAGVGETLEFTVDLTTTGHDAALVYGFDSPVSVQLGGGQVLLCFDLLGSGGALLDTGLAPGPMAVFSFDVPNSPALAGFRVWTQALHVFGVFPFALSNAQDLRIGGCR